ncbi:gluconeogenesis factor [Clostridium tepidiprofundi DSM 19306]|uniref:Putative gluconeogenesis factor n=1 Tax=Clostridium tepidiprofundi DSM 19306 TaxID=1121338 RepID=A0A151B632_9CLOT|nr:gluconeogenesis factor [Clostridium tepidiprofundi DSM 19306]
MMFGQKIIDYEKSIDDTKIVVIGGGTGLSTILRGLKAFTSNITAIVTVADDGGGSGVLRHDLGMIPPGDIRNCILALADTEPVMEELLQYRFKEGILKNQSFGNLFLAAMDGISENFMEAVRKMSYVLAVKGKVLPVSLDKITLKAKLKNGQIVSGESNIPKAVIESRSGIDSVFIEPKNAKALYEAVIAIREADIVILGPGSLYTSIIPNILVNEISDELYKTKAVKVYISNIMTQRGETDGYNVSEHINAILNHAGKDIIDYVIVNTGTIDKELEKRYLEEEASIVNFCEKEINNLNIKIIKGDFVKVKNEHVRHDADKISSVIMKNFIDI